jgi:hypothetical protein
MKIMPYRVDFAEGIDSIEHLLRVYEPFIHEMAKGGCLALSGSRINQESANSLIGHLGYEIGQHYLIFASMFGKMKSQNQESLLIDLAFNMNNFSKEIIGKSQITLERKDVVNMLDKILMSYQKLKDCIIQKKDS